jgi:hypothetical protein
MIIGISTFEYAAIYWLGDQNIWQVELMTSLKLNKPWVYRQLVPILARGLASLGIRIDLALVLVVTIAGAGFYLALRSLAFLFYKKDDKADILIILLVLLGMIIFSGERLPYDLMTAWLFTLAIWYMARGDDIRLLIIFALACLNRETAFLLIICMGMLAIKTGARYLITLQMTLIFILVQLALRIVFHDNAGLVWIEPMQNLARFANHPERTLAHGSITLVLLWTVCRDWKQKPYYFRLALMSLAPPLILMYPVFGQAFEVRVFWEIYPILALLMLPTLHDWLTTKNTDW